MGLCSDRGHVWSQESSIMSLSAWSRQELLWVQDLGFSFSPVIPAPSVALSPCLSCSSMGPMTLPQSCPHPRSASSFLQTLPSLDLELATVEAPDGKTGMRNRDCLLEILFCLLSSFQLVFQSSNNLFFQFNINDRTMSLIFQKSMTQVYKKQPCFWSAIGKGFLIMFSPYKASSFWGNVLPHLVAADPHDLSGLSVLVITRLDRAASWQRLSDTEPVLQSIPAIQMKILA